MCENLLTEFFFSLSGHMYKNLLAMSLFFFLVGHMHGNLLATSLSFARWDITEQKFSICPQTKTPFHQSQYKITAIKSVLLSFNRLSFIIKHYKKEPVARLLFSVANINLPKLL